METQQESPLPQQPSTPANRCQIIAIAGASGSGKSYLAKHIAKALRAPILSLDSYYRDLSHLSPEDRAKQNFDHPDALDWTLLALHLSQLARGHDIRVPVYDFQSHSRLAETVPLPASRYLVIEGILALHHPAVRDATTLKVFVELPTAVCLARRLDRDVRERGRSADSVHQQYEQTVLPMFRQFVEPSRCFADVCVRGDNFAALSAQVVLDHLRKSLTSD